MLLLILASLLVMPESAISQADKMVFGLHLGGIDGKTGSLAYIGGSFSRLQGGLERRFGYTIELDLGPEVTNDFAGSEP